MKMSTHDPMGLSCRLICAVPPPLRAFRISASRVGSPSQPALEERAWPRSPFSLTPSSSKATAPGVIEVGHKSLSMWTIASWSTAGAFLGGFLVNGSPTRDLVFKVASWLCSVMSTKYSTRTPASPPSLKKAVV